MSHNLNVIYEYNNPVLTWLPYPDSEVYRVYRGLVQGNMTKIAETQALQYQDNQIDLAKIFDREKYYYQISSVNQDGKEIFFTDPVQFQLTVDYPYQGIINEFIRRNNLMLDRMVGEPVDLYIKKGSGERCSNYNTITKNHDSMEEICSECYNTTFKGGFIKLNSIKVRIKNANDSITETPYGIKIESAKQGYLSNYPLVHTDDWIRTLQGEIYIVNDVKHSKLRGIITKQIVTLSLLNTGHPYYQIN